MRSAWRLARAWRIALCVALSVELSGCALTRDAFFKAWGYDNELLVRAVVSVDQAWRVPGKGVVLAGNVTPGRFWGDPIHFNPHDDPPMAPYVTALALWELRSRYPRLHYTRFLRAKSQDVECIEKQWGGVRLIEPPKPREVELQDPADTSLWQLTLERQEIRVPEIEGIEPQNPVRLGPHGGDWLYYLALPVAAAADVVLFVWPRASTEPETEICAQLEHELFPEEPPLDARTAKAAPPSGPFRLGWLWSSERP